MNLPDREPLIFRVDADAKLGTGHLMRCFALAQAWKDKGGQALFITTCRNELLLQRLQEERFVINIIERTEDWEKTKDIIKNFPDAWVVLDGYHFHEEYQQKLKETGRRLLVIDDMAHLKHYYADIVLNQNLHAEELYYSCEHYTQLLLGTKYVLLRREFRVRRGREREAREKVLRILVTLGGADPDNCTLKVIKAFQQLKVPGLGATVVIGGSNPHSVALGKIVKQSRMPISIFQKVKNMPELMARMDIAVSSGGATVWELAFMGVPTMVGITAQIEDFLVKGLEKHNLFTNIGWFKAISVKQLTEKLYGLIQDKVARNDMIKLGQKLIDGNGCDNTLHQLLGQEVK